MSLRETADIFEVEYTIKKKVLDRLSALIGQLRKGRLLADENAAYTRLSWSCAYREIRLMQGRPP